MMKKTVKIGLRNRGVYDPSATYDILDFVASNNALYISKCSDNVGHTLSEEDYWQRAIHGSAGVTEEEIEKLLGDYWKKDDLQNISIEIINSLN